MSFLNRINFVCQQVFLWVEVGKKWESVLLLADGTENLETKPVFRHVLLCSDYFCHVLSSSFYTLELAH